MHINLAGIIPLSTNEWKDHVSIVVFFNGCPFRCSYCHNFEMIDAINYVDIEIVKEKILESKVFINSLVCTGGEPTMQPKALEELLSFAKTIELNTAVETNGYYPDVIRDLCNKNIIDMLFVDIKTTEEDYPKLTGVNNSYKNMLETLRVTVSHTKRTTVFKNIKIPRCSLNLQRGLIKLSPDKNLGEYTVEEFEQLIHNK